MKSICYFVNEICTSFVINDLRKIAEQYEIVYLFSVDKLQGKEKLPNNVTVFEEFMDWKSFRPIKIFLVNFFSILSAYSVECMMLKKILPPKRSLSLLVSNIYKAESAISKLPKNFEGTFYSFWFYDCIFLAWLKKNRTVKKAITRTHGGDLFEERGSLKRKILFRNFQLKHLDYVFSVSEAGTQYLRKKYPSFAHKIKTLFLGSPYHNQSSSVTIESNFILVSCARVRDIKRIHKIAEMLKYVNFPLTWYHIGSENLESKDATIPLYKKAKQELENHQLVKYIPLGVMDNRSVLDFYSKTPVNLFISLSEAEGIPVSMMEAISYGIPVLSTDVGGCKEVVNERTGVLIPLETTVQQVAQTILEFKNSKKNTSEYRDGVRKFWTENFNTEKNYEAFFELV